MNKQAFLTVLRSALSGLPQEDTEERLAFYSEMIDDRMEEGLSEEEAVADIGPVNKIVSQALADVPLMKLVKEKVKPKRSLKGWEIALIILGSPLWISLLAVGFSLVVALYAVIFSLVVSLWAVEVALWSAWIGGVVSAVIFFVQGHTVPAFAWLGAGIFCAGLAMLFLFVVTPATKGLVLLSKKVGIGVKSLFVRKERAK